MLSEERILRQLSQAGYRITQPRRAVVRALLEDDGYSNAAKVHERARLYCPGVGLVTIYRTLDLLSEAGFLRRIHSQDGCHGYAPIQRGHRHHLICRRCGAAVEFKGCDLVPFLDRVSDETGYRIEEHLLELIGLCSTCQELSTPCPHSQEPSPRSTPGHDDEK
ncbi:MAG: transcriptional repressor [Anaerolineae bacterium]|nr:transcriptional repressor [Anaerolineae bacterium]